MSNSDPSAIVLHGIPCIDGLYISRFEWRNQFAQGSPRFTLSRSRMRSRTGLPSPVEYQACGIAKYPRFERPHRSSLAKLTVFVEPVEGDFSILADLDEVAVGITHLAAPFPAVIV